MARSSHRLFRRIWLPAWLYESLPWLYLATGALALLSGLFGPEGGWYYPYLALAGLAAVHAGLAVAAARFRARRRRRIRQRATGAAAS